MTTSSGAVINTEEVETGAKAEDFGAGGVGGNGAQGLPLTVAIALVSAWMARWLWLGGPLLPGLAG